PELVAEQAADVEHGQDRSMQVTDATDRWRRRRHVRDEPQTDDLANPPQLERVTPRAGTARADREHDDVAQLGHGASIRQRAARRASPLGGPLRPTARTVRRP